MEIAAGLLQLARVAQLALQPGRARAGAAAAGLRHEARCLGPASSCASPWVLNSPEF